MTYKMLDIKLTNLSAYCNTLLLYLFYVTKLTLGLVNTIILCYPFLFDKYFCKYYFFFEPQSHVLFLHVPLSFFL